MTERTHAPATGSRRAATITLLVALCTSRVCDAGVDEWVRAFASSEFQFQRQVSNVPFPPLAWVGAAQYGSTPLHTLDGGDAGSFDQTSISEAAMVPWLLDPRDMLVLGQWASLTRFDADRSTDDDLDVLSIAIPIGWVRQQSDEWQFAAFAAPLGHRITDHGAPWYWEYMGGVFARYVPQGRWSWIFGAFADVSPDDDFYIPYAGAAFQIDQRWQLSLVLPWPALLYAPTPDWLVRLGVFPAGTSWAVEPDRGKIALDMDAWNIGLGIERRVWRNVWLRAEGGVSGFRGFTFLGSDWQGPNSDEGTSPYATIGISFRPAGPAKAKPSTARSE